MKHEESAVEGADALVSYRDNQTLVAFRPLKLLHVSDLHFVTHPILKRIHPSGLRGHNPNATDALITKAKEIAPDLVFATGDQTTWGDRQSLRAVRAFLLGLIHELGLPEERLFYTPGNHDVLLHYYRPFSGSGRNYDRVFGPPEAIRLLTVNGYKLAIFSFDSTIKREQKGILWPIKGSMGRVSPQAFNKFNLARQTCVDLCNRVKIAQVHHHPLPIPHKSNSGVEVELTTMSNGGTFIAHMQECDVQLVLHGHEHVPYSCAYRFSTTSPELIVVAAGTACQSGNDRASFNFVQVLPGSRTIVSEYVYSEVGFRIHKDSVKVWPDSHPEVERQG
jgi:3',5'-cyclic AMP phosphodiesterase CpdA